MKLFALLTCDSVNIDQASGKHFIFGNFSSIKVANFPATHPSLTLFVGLTNIPAGEHLLVLKCGLPNIGPPPKKQLWSKPPPDPMQPIVTQNINSLGENQRLYLISELKELYLEKPGSYLLQVLIDGNEVGSVSLEVS